jgi:uncharacterized membrane protein YebE (DUF533 family)
MKKFLMQHETKIDVLVNGGGMAALMYTAGSGAAINVAICFFAAAVLVAYNYYHGYWRGEAHAEGLTESDADNYFAQAKEALETAKAELVKANEFKRAARDMLDATCREARHSLTTPQ